MVKMSDVNKDIGMRIRELRELSDITTEEIAKELDVDEETYISYENGIIDHTSQRSISGEKLRLAWENYAWGELARQAQGKDGKRGSTGTGGKGCDSFDRLHMAYMRDYNVEIVDIACRPAGLPDITVYCDEKAY